MSRRPRIIYVKTPKTGGTSVEHALRSCLGSHIRISGRTRRWPREQQLATYSLIVVGDVVASSFRSRFPALWEDSNSFAIVRDPSHRAVSAWKYCASTKNETLIDALTTKFPRKKRFRRYDADYVHFAMQQADFLIDEGIPIVDVIVRFENLTADLERFLKLQGITLTDGLPHLNKGPLVGGAENVLTSEARRAIYSRYPDDFRYFGYDKPVR